MFFVWELKWTQEPPPSLHCRFSIGFSPASEEQLSISLKPYTYEFQVENFFVCITLFFWWGSEVEAWKVMSYSLPSKSQTDKIFQYNEATCHGNEPALGAWGQRPAVVRALVLSVACLPLGPSCVTPAEHDHLQGKDSSSPPCCLPYTDLVTSCTCSFHLER